MPCNRSETCVCDAAIVGAAAFLYNYYQRQSTLSKSTARCPAMEKNTTIPTREKSNSNARAEEEAKKKAETSSYKKLYYEVQNLEKFPETIPFAWQTLLSLLRSCSNRRIFNISTGTEYSTRLRWIFTNMTSDNDLPRNSIREEQETTGKPGKRNACNFHHFPVSTNGRDLMPTSSYRTDGFW